MTSSKKQQLDTCKAALAGLQDEINEAKNKVMARESQLEKAIQEGKPDSILASFKSLYDGASAYLTGLQNKKTELLKQFSQLNHSPSTSNDKIRPTSDWEISTLPQLTYDVNSPLFQLDSDYLAKTGLPTQKLVLYCRPTFHEQFKFLREKVIDGNVLGWVLGPPGTGKSTTTLAFASTLERNEWVISWIHLDRNRFPVYVRLEGDSKKSREIYDANIDELYEILKEIDSSKKHIVFIDGYALNGRKHIDVQQVCYFWLNKDREKRRLVVVCSMSSRYKAKPEKDMQLNVKEFFVYSWKKEEYLEAVKHPEFFVNVESVLDTDLSVETVPSPENLVLSKLYFAGASARWMFLFPTKTIVEQTNESVASVDDIITYINGTIGDMSNHVINRLLSSSFFPHDIFHRKVSIVSRFAAVMLAIKAGPDLIRRLAEATRLDKNPSMDGWMLEMWFLASLRHGGVKLLDNNDKKVQTWPEANVETLDVTSFPRLPENNGVWFKPSKWNQGGFDATYVDKSKGLVRFVQVTGADAHSFKLEYFYGFLLALSHSKDSFPITCLEIFFVVDRKKRSKFILAEPSGQGLLQPFGWQHGKEKERVQIVYVSGWTDE
jgi:DNA polymerase III delta prime subunit